MQCEITQPARFKEPAFTKPHFFRVASFVAIIQLNAVCASLSKYNAGANAFL